MATLSGTLIVNRRAPVRAWLIGDLDKTRDFKNMDEFEDWYRPSFHGDASKKVVSQYLFTDVPLESISDPPRGGSSAPKVAKPGSLSSGPVRSRVVVDGKEYGSVYKAFVGLALPIKAHGKFRADLKRSGSLAFEWGGKKYQFNIIGS